MAVSGGFGVTLNFGDDEMSGSPVYTAVANVEEIGGFKVSAIMDEFTGHDSTGGYREKIPSGLMEVGDVSLKVAFDITEGTHANAAGGLTYAQQNRLKRAFQIVFPDASDTTFTFDAYVSELEIESPKENHLMGNLVLTVTGQPTIS